jgi:hypothetical protein
MFNLGFYYKWVLENQKIILNYSQNVIIVLHVNIIVRYDKLFCCTRVNFMNNKNIMNTYVNAIYVAY